MHPFYKEFVEHIESSEKDWCVERVLSWLIEGEINISILYNEILRPALIGEACEKANEGICIWKEHVRTSIIRTIIEACYPYVIKEKKAKVGEARGQKVMVVCPTEELHEMGARMVADFFTLYGYEVIFVGANTPQSQVLEGIDFMMPDYIAVGVTNHYNLVAARKLIESLRGLRQTKGMSFKIIVGGQAFEKNKELVKELGADHQIQGLDDIKALKRGA